ncbi:MAG: hypothetical protein SGCHY_003499 [Lobulomycetales sp.]
MPTQRNDSLMVVQALQEGTPVHLYFPSKAKIQKLLEEFAREQARVDGKLEFATWFEQKSLSTTRRGSSK